MRLTARETVAMETPARLATSRMLVAPRRRLSDGLDLEGLTVRLYAYWLFLNHFFAVKNGVTG
jgi:hypothetical protein